MGSESSKTAEAETERLREAARVAQERVRVLEEQQQAEWRRANALENHHRQQRLHEEERLKQEREKWQREENFRQQQLQQKLLNEQKARAQLIQQEQLQRQKNQNVLQHQAHQHQLQQQELQQRNACSPSSNIYPLLPSVPNEQEIATVPWPNVPSLLPSAQNVPQAGNSQPAKQNILPQLPSAQNVPQPGNSQPAKRNILPQLPSTQNVPQPGNLQPAKQNIPPLLPSAQNVHEQVKSRLLKTLPVSARMSMTKFFPTEDAVPSPSSQDSKTHKSRVIKFVQATNSNQPKPLQTSGARVQSSSRDSKTRHRSDVAGRSASRDTKQKSNETPKTGGAATSNVRCVNWTEVDYIQETHQTSRYVAENIVKLLKEDNTVPFIACYRKNMTLGMSADQLRNIKESYERVKLIKKKADAIIKDIDNQGDGSIEFRAFVWSIKSLSDLEYIHSVYKITKSSPAERAREFGLGITAQAVMKGERIDPLCYLVKPRMEGMKVEEQVKEGVVCILADMINKDESTLEKIKILRAKYPVSIETSKFNRTMENEKKTSRPNRQKDDDTKQYEIYYNFSSFETKLNPEQILAINRGQARKFLSVNVNIPAEFEQDFKEYCASQYDNACNASPLHRMLLTAAFDYVWTKSIKLSVRRRTRNELTERAEVALMNEFAGMIKQLLLTPPVRCKVVVGIYPGFRHGCKLAVVSEQGDVLETETIYPHDANNPVGKKEAQRTLARIVLVHRCTIFAIGSGTACRETEVFLSELIKQGAFEPISNVLYTIVDETAASIYSCSNEASVEFPDFDANVVSAICIARRLQDPMAELVKIEPKHLGVGINQHNLPEKQLAMKLNEVIMEVVSFVVVDINTASLSLLKRVAGLNESKAKHIIEWRESSGPLRTRNDLKKIPGICSKTFEQCAGFVRIMPETAIGDNKRATNDSLNYLDQTWIHPESYDIAEVFLKAANCNPLHLGTKPFIFTVKLFADQGFNALAKKCNTDFETMKIIVDGLSVEKGQDIRAKADMSMFRKSVMSFDDLTVGMVLTGVVRCNKPFGAFVDVGVERDGLIPKSMLGDRTLSVGQRVETKVNNIQKERGRLALALIRCI